jgi:hypothetical protein
MKPYDFSRLTAIVLCWCLLLSGCASRPVPPLLAEDRVAVIPARYPPQANFNVYARGKSAAAGRLGAAGAGKGAAIGAIVPLEAGPAGMVAYPIIAPFTILAGAIVGGAIGAGSGAIHGLSAEDAERVSVLVDQAVQQLGIHEQLARRVVERAHGGGKQADLVLDAGPLAAEQEMNYSGLGATHGAVLELTMDKVGMSARKGDPPRIALEMQVSARVVNLKGGSVSGIKQLKWAGRPRNLQEWATGGSDLLAANFEEGYETLAQYIWEIVFQGP